MPRLHFFRLKICINFRRASGSFDYAKKIISCSNIEACSIIAANKLKAPCFFNRLSCSKIAA